MSTINFQFKDIPAKFWVILGLAFFLVGFGIMYSFIKGWSKIEHTKNQPIEKVK